VGSSFEQERCLLNKVSSFFSTANPDSLEHLPVGTTVAYSERCPLSAENAVVEVNSSVGLAFGRAP